MRLYLDTSVLSALFDDRSPERKRLTEDFFGIVGRHEPYVSELTLAEIELTPDENLRSRMQARCADLPVLSGKERQAADLAQEYVRHGAVPSTYVEDALHLATAVVHGMDAVLSWNFRHIVRRKTRNVVDLVNVERNLRKIEIMTPAELL